MDIFQLNELTDKMMHLCDDKFYNFLEVTLNKDLCELFRVQAIRNMSSLSSVTLDQTVQMLTVEIIDLRYLRKSLGFVTTDGVFHLRLGHRNLLERLLMLVKCKKNSIIKNIKSTNKYNNNHIQEKLLEIWKQTSSSSNETDVPILFRWITNGFKNLEKTEKQI